MLLGSLDHLIDIDHILHIPTAKNKWRCKPMLSKIPIDISKVKPEDINKEILRAAIIAELDAINLYEQMAALTDNKEVKEVLLDIAKEEKTHVGEFQTLLLREDEQQVQEMEKGKLEVDEMTK
jgi:rubrerythrin